MKKIIYALCFMGWAGICSAANTARMISDVGDWIGQGQEYLLDETTGSLGVSLSGNVVSIDYSGAGSWHFSFFARDSLQPGSYFEALRYPFQGPTNPGLSVYGDGRGCNNLTGSFVIYEFETSGNTVTKFSADFEQHCEGASAALRGSVRVNSLLPMPNPAPVVYAGKDKEVGESVTVTLDGSKSNSPLGALSYHWQQLSGPLVVLQENTSEVTTFVAPVDVDLGGEDLVFSLTVTDLNNETATTQVTIHVRSKSDPVTYLSMSSDVGDYIGGGLDWHYSTDNAQFNLTNNANGVSIYIDGSTWWNLDFAAPNNDQLQKQIYAGATRFPFQDSSAPGMSVSGDGRGCNTLTGEYEVQNIVYESQTVSSFAAIFTQHCEGGMPALKGEIHINDVPASVPIANAGQDITARENSVVTLNGSGSSDADGMLAHYNWRQLDGPPVALSDDTSSYPNFTAPTLGNQETSTILVFKLTVTDDLGYKAASAVQVTVQKKNEHSEGGGGGGIDLYILLSLFCMAFKRMNKDSLTGMRL